MKNKIEFKKWLEDTKHHFLWGDDVKASSHRDSLGIPILKRPGFRPKEKKFIQNQSKQTEEWLNSITKKYGLNWLILYIEPNEKETDSREGFEQYKNRSIEIAKNKFQEFVSDWKPIHPDSKPPNPNNTIVYVKPTSRVHQLSSHQQVHNIAHALWGYAKIHQAKFILKLKRIVHSIQKRIKFDLESLPLNPLGYKENVQKSIIKKDTLYRDATEEEIILVIARLLNLKSMSRIFSMTPEDFSNPKKTINQVYGNWEEFLYEMVAAFFRGNGRLNLKPQEIFKNKMNPTQGVQQHPSLKSPSSWVWNSLPTDSKFWDDVGDELTLIIVEALYDCTYSKVGRPIYATYGGLPRV